MPTRIVLREGAPSPVSRSGRNLRAEFANNSADDVLDANEEKSIRNSSSRIGSPRMHTSSGNTALTRRTSLRFRSSILRQVDEEPPTEARELGTDIRSSPRLIGYMYVFMSSLVLFVSMVQFYNERKSTEVINQFRFLDETGASNNDTMAPSAAPTEPPLFESVFGREVLSWKLDTAIVLAPVGFIFSCLVVLAHFDTILFPNLWKKIFQDGSSYERNLLLFLLCFWAGTVYVSTSIFSVGEVQANVYFVSWIAFWSTAMNYNIWRTGADLIRDMIKHG